MGVRSHTSPTPLPKLLFGVAYYPEHDTPEQLAEDVQRLKNAAVNVVRMGDFAWSLIEPEDNCFEFALLDRHIARLAEAGIETILCTPTAAPPRWLTRKHPDLHAENSNGQPMLHGSRQHASLSNRRFRDYCRRITEALAAHYASNRAVVGWQIDNEFHCHLAEDYSPAVADGFRLWLQKKYGMISALNEAWGASFWSQTWPDFTSIELPRTDRPTHVNPHQWLDYKLYLSDAARSFQQEQVDVLRAANPNWWITHNGFFRNIDYRKLAEGLSFLSLDLYPQFAPPHSRSEWAAQKLSQTCSFSGNFIVAELQSGPGGQGDYFHDRPEPGQARLWAWQSIAHGADGVIYFRWRSCPFGAEQYWEGILNHDNQPGRLYREVAQTGEEVRRLSSVLTGSVRRPEVVILFDTGLLEMGHEPITHGLPAPSEIGERLFSAARQQFYDVGFVHPLDDLSGVKLAFLPSMPLLTEEVIAALERWTAQGGTLCITARSGRKDGRGHVHRATPPGPLKTLIGASIAEYSRLNGEPQLHLTWAEEAIREAEWREALSPSGATTLAVWQGGRMTGAAAITMNRIGNGQCIYIGTYPSIESAPSIMSRCAKLSRAKPLLERSTDQLEVIRRVKGDGEELLFVLNHSNFPAEFPALEGQTLLGPASGGQIEPHGVLILRRKNS